MSDMNRLSAWLWAVAGLMFLSSAAPLAAQLPDLDNRAPIDVWRADHRGHSGRYVGDGDGGHALALSWSGGAQRLAELMVRDRPVLGNWQQGQELPLWVAVRPAGGVAGIAVRLVDEGGEVYQFPLRPERETEGWQRLTFRLEPAAAETVYGDNRNGRFDGELRLLGFAAITPGEPEQPVTLILDGEQHEGEPPQAAAPGGGGADRPGGDAQGAAGGGTTATMTPLDGSPGEAVLPIRVVQVAARRGGGGLQVHAANRHNQAARASDDEGTVALEWQQGARGLMEAIVRDAPRLEAFDAGVELSIPVNAQDMSGFRAMAVRARDAHGEVFQWPVRLDPDARGWQDVRVRLTPDGFETSYGGPAEHRGRIDPPVRLQSLLLLSPQDGATGRVQLGTISRNAFDPEAISVASRLASVAVQLQHDGPIPVFDAGADQPLRVMLHNQGAAEAALDVVLRFEDVWGESLRIPRPGLTLAAGEQAIVNVPLAELDRTGWFALTPTLRPQGGDAEGLSVDKRSVQLAVMHPAGVRELPEGGFWFGMDARIRNPERDEWMAEVMAMIGCDFARSGRTWPHIQPDGPDDWRWDNHRQVLELLDRHGLSVLYGLSFTPQWAARPEFVGQGLDRGELSRTPPRLEPWRTFVSEVAQFNAGRNVIAYEMWNEPDLSGFFRGSTDQFMEMFRIASEQVEQHHPQAVMIGAGIATLGGHGGHNLNPDMIDRTILASDLYEAIGLHQHGTFDNFVTGIDGRLAALRAQLPRPRPLFFTETGVPDDDGARHAHTLVKKIVFARARNTIGFTWFVLAMGHEDHFALVNFRDRSPRPQLVAYNELVKLMRPVEFVAEHDMGPGAWAIEFEGDGQRLLVAWAEQSSAVGESVVVAVPHGATVERIDIMGNAQPHPSRRGLASLALTEQVQYLRVSGAAAGQSRVAGSLASFEQQVFGEPGRQVQAAARLLNPTEQPASYDLTWQVTGADPVTQSLEVPAGQSVRATLPLRIPTPQADGPEPEVSLNYQLQGTELSGTLTMPIGVAQLIPAAGPDGREPDFTLDQLDETIINVNQNDPNRRALVWTGPEDLSARLWLTRSDRGIELWAHVRDDVHVQPFPADEMWKADSLQFGLQVPGQTGFWEFGVSVGDDGPRAYTFSTPTGMADPTDQLEVDAQIVDGGVNYHVVLPDDAIQLPDDQPSLAFNLIVNDDDTGDREGWAQISEGIARGKDPSAFPLLFFTD